MLLAVYEPGEVVTLIVAREQHLVDAVPLWLAVVARGTAQLHLPRGMIDAPVATTKTHVAMLHEMTMQRDHPKPETTVTGYYKLWIGHFLVQSSQFTVHNSELIVICYQ